jgi:Spy/CpxP family protein refolding chaperone
MRKQIVSLTLSTLFGLGVAMAAPQAPDQAAPAQNGQYAGRQMPDPNRQLQRLTKRLNLTADQQNQILPILTDRQQQMQSILADNSLAPKDRHAKMRAVREDSDAKVRAILTDSQKQTYDQMQQQMRERARQHRQDAQNPGSAS